MKETKALTVLGKPAGNVSIFNNVDQFELAHPTSLNECLSALPLITLIGAYLKGGYNE